MTGPNTGIRTHPAEPELAAYLDNSLNAQEREQVESHIASCGECLESMVSAYEAVKSSHKDTDCAKKRRLNFMKRINVYLMLAIISFTLSFVTPRYFLQLLVATLILGIKWVADSRSTKMLVMIYEAWKNGGEKEAGRILKTLDPQNKNRF